MPCKGCHHPQRDWLDHEIVAGRPLRQLVAVTGISLGALSRHRAHVKELVRETMLKDREPDERREHGAGLAARIEGVITEAKDICERAKARNSFAAATGALNTITRSLELIARMTGEIQPAANVGGGIHFHAHKHVHTQRVDDDEEIALLIQEATQDFDPAVIERFKRLTQKAPVPAILCNARATPSVDTAD